MESTREITWKQFLSQTVILFALLVATFPRVFFHGELLSSADLLFMLPPWEKYAPEGFKYPKNQLMFDPVMAFRPDYLLTQQCLKQGEWPVWNPLEYGGVPLLANCQSTVFYPLRLMLLFLDVDTAMTTWIILKLLLCGVTAFVCARMLRLSLAASRFFSVAWMLCSYNIIWANWPLVDVSAWIPVLFAGANFIIEGRYRRGFFAMLLGGAMILYAGHPETAFTMSMGLGTYFIFRLIADYWMPLARPARVSSLLRYFFSPLISAFTSKRVWKCIAVSLAAWSIALLVYTPQLLPFAEFLTHSYTFNDRHEKELIVEFRAGGAAAVFVPRFFGTNAERNFWDKEKWNSNIMGKQYPGIIIWCAIALLAVRLPAGSALRHRNKQIAALIAASIFATLLAYHVWPFSIIHSLPVFSSMLEIYHICFAIFAMPLLGAIAIERWLSHPRKLRDLYPIGIVAAAGCAIVGITYVFNAQYLDVLARKEYPNLVTYIHNQFLIAAVFLALSAALFAASCYSRRTSAVWVAAAALFLSDHWIATRGLNPTLPRKEVYPRTELTDFLSALPKPCRVSVSQANIYSGSIVNYGIEEWLGYDGLFPERVIRYQSELKDSVWKAMEPAHSLQYFVNDGDPRFEPNFPYKEMLAEGRIEKIGEFDRQHLTLDVPVGKDSEGAPITEKREMDIGLEVYKNLEAFPRAYLVGKLEIIPDRDELIKAMMVPGFKPGKIALAEKAPQAPLPNSDEETIGTARVEDWKYTSTRVSYEAKTDAVLVLADAIYPGWNAYLDGKPVEMFPVFYMFRGIIVPAGAHTVDYRYEPVPLRIGLAIASPTLVLSSLACLWWLMKRNRRARP